MDKIVEAQRETPIAGRSDVLVIGGGMTGVIAAVSAARQGAETTLIERSAFLGGVGTMGLPYQGFFDTSGRQVVKGVAQELVDRLRAAKGASQRFIPCEMHNPFLVVEPEKVKTVTQQMVVDAGVQLHLHTYAVDVLKNGSSLDALIVEGKSGRQALQARTYIDATGDGDVAARCDCPFTIGNEKDGLTQASTLMFQLGNVDVRSLVRRVLDDPEKYDLLPTLPRPQFRYLDKHILVGLGRIVEQARQEGLTNMPWDRVCYITMLREDTVAVNMVHVKGLYAADSKDLTEIEVDGRRQVDHVTDFLRMYVPGFEEAHLIWTAAWSGIRETRHIQGAYVLSESDVRNGSQFEDAVAVGGYPIDIHKSSDGDGLTFEKVPSYEIPYRCLVPQGIDNLLIAGRCISATHEAMASARVMGTCMATGHAAGVAAAMAGRKQVACRDLQHEQLRDKLLSEGAVLKIQ